MNVLINICILALLLCICVLTCLTRWRFVVHGGVDGYSRVIVFMGVSDNNRAATVLNLFKDAVTQWGLPYRVR